MVTTALPFYCVRGFVVFLLQEAGKGCNLLKILSMRSLFLTLTPVLLSATLSATLTAQGVFSNKTQVILEKVIQDYPNHFYNIKGELISQAFQLSRYRSTVQLPGAQTSVITVVSGNQGSDWSCTVLETKSFTEAREKFSSIYSQLSGSIITTGGQKTFILTGQYETPAEEKKSTLVIFSLLPAVGDMKRLKVELVLREENNVWKIQLSVEDTVSA
jgi:hypothetical protein